MIRRVVVAAVAAVMFAMGMVFASVAPAHAFGEFCKDTPEIRAPKSGFSGLLTMRPAQPAPEGANPFADGRVAIHDVYGSSWGWSLYDIGCTDLPGQVMYGGVTQQANFIIDVAAAGVAVIDMLERFARATGVGWFADWVGQVQEVLTPLVFGGSSAAGPMVGLLVLAAVVAAIWIAKRGASHADLSEAVRKGLIVVVCVVLATWAVAIPGLSSRTVDTAVTSAAGVAATSFNASLADGVNRQSLYRSWLAGQFGDPDSKAAKDYGPRVMAATHYTWTEWDRVQTDPEYRKTLDEKKSEDFKAVAKKLEENNPAAYGHFQGRGMRVGTAVFALVSGSILGVFAFIAFAIILIARVMMQILVIAAPIAAIAGMLPKGESGLRRMWDLFVAAIWAVFKFTLAAGLMAMAFGMLAQLDDFLAMFVWMTALTVAALVVLKPIKTFKTMTPGLDPNTSYIKKLIALLAKLIASAVTGGTAGAVAGAVAAGAGRQQVGDLTVPQQAGRERVALSTVQSPPPLPASQFQQIPGTHRHAALEPGKGGPSYGVEPPADAVGLRPLPVGPAGSGGAAAELPAGTARVDGPTRLRIDGPITVPTPRQDQVVIAGEIVVDGGTYQRPGPDVPSKPAGMDLSGSRDRGTDQPLDELVLYQSRKG